MENILTFDTDLMFPATKMIIDLSGATTPAETIAKIQDDLLLVSLILTFRTATTKTSQATWNTKWLQFNPTIRMAMSDTDSVFSTEPFQKKTCLTSLIASWRQCKCTKNQKLPIHQLKSHLVWSNQEGRISSQESSMSTLHILQKTRCWMLNRETTTHSTTSNKRPSKQWANTNNTNMHQSQLTMENTIKRQTTTAAEQLHTTLHETQTKQQKTKIYKTSRKKIPNTRARRLYRQSETSLSVGR